MRETGRGRGGASIHRVFLGVHFTLNLRPNPVTYFLSAKRRNSRNKTHIEGLRSFQRFHSGLTGTGLGPEPLREKNRFSKWLEYSFSHFFFSFGFLIVAFLFWDRDRETEKERERAYWEAAACAEQHSTFFSPSLSVASFIHFLSACRTLSVRSLQWWHEFIEHFEYMASLCFSFVHHLDNVLLLLYKVNGLS